MPYIATDDADYFESFLLAYYRTLDNSTNLDNNIIIEHHFILSMLFQKIN